VSDPVEMHRPIAVGQVGVLGLEREVIATAEECVAIAVRLRIPAVAALACRFRLVSLGGGVVAADGVLAARVTQECVVTTDPFEAEVQEAFRVRFVPEDQFVEPDEEDLLDLESDDELPYAGTQIDLGEAAVEQLALALDPYPRKPGAALDEGDLPADPDDEPTSPFAALARRTRPG
jgi:uncharacterized metal-binding protein YceD (DUF177 family)